MARCQYCLTECRTEWNILTRTCSRCQNNTKRKLKYSSIREDLKDKVKPVIETKPSSTNREFWEEKLKQSQLKVEQTRIDTDQASKKLQDLIDEINNYKF